MPKIIQTSQDIKLNNIRVGVLKVYLTGSGDPKTMHSILGFSIDGQGQGILPPTSEIDIFEDNMADILLAGKF
jgi:hypothetical protein